MESRISSRPRDGAARIPAGRDAGRRGGPGKTRTRRCCMRAGAGAGAGAGQGVDAAAALETVGTGLRAGGRLFWTAPAVPPLGSVKSLRPLHIHPHFAHALSLFNSPSRYDDPPSLPTHPTPSRASSPRCISPASSAPADFAHFSTFAHHRLHIVFHHCDPNLNPTPNRAGITAIIAMIGSQPPSPSR